MANTAEQKVNDKKLTHNYMCCMQDLGNFLETLKANLLKWSPKKAKPKNTRW